MADLLHQAELDTLAPTEFPITSAAGDDTRFSVAAEELAGNIDKLLDDGTLDVRLKDGERELLVNVARDFHAKYADMRLPISTGGVLFFAPSEEVVARRGSEEAAWAKYAIHAVTNDNTGKDGKRYVRSMRRR